MTPPTPPARPAPPGPADGLAPRFPWSLIGAGLVAMAGMYLHPEGRFVGMIVLAVLLVLSRVLTTRLPDQFFVRWTIRVVAYAAILTVLGWPADEIPQWYVKPAFMTRIGPLVAVELVLRAFLAKPARKTGFAWGEGLVFSAGVMIPATTTYVPGPLHFLAPAYVLFAMLTVRRIAAVTSPPGTQEGIARRRPLITLQRLAVGAVGLALGLAVVLTITNLERQLTQWAVRMLQFDRGRSQNEVGFSATPELQPIFNPRPSMERALVLEGVRGERHVRITAFPQYVGGRWLPHPQDRTFSPPAPDELSPPSGHRGRAAGTPSGPRRITVRLIADVSHDYLPIPTGAIGLETSAPLEREPHGMFRVSGAGALSDWTLIEGAPDGVPSPGMVPNPADPAELLALPETVDPRVFDLARRIAGDGPPLERVRRLESYLRSSHAYSLRFDPPPPPADPLSDFVLNKRAGHCQYFGSALAIMARAADVPARFVTGYYAHEPSGEDTVVRERDAHAWTECYIEGTGWVLADATPAGGRPDELFPKPSLARRTWETLTDLPGKIREWIASGALFRILLPAFILAAAIAGGRALWRSLRARRTANAPTLAADAQLREAAERFERILSRRGIVVPPTATWRDALAAASLSPHIAPDLLAVRLAYERARFGTPTAEELQALLSTLRTLEAAPPVRT